MGILDFFRKKKKKPREGLHDARVNFYSNPGTFDVHFERRNKREKKKIMSVKDVAFDDDFDPRSKLFRKKK